jgi:hypothetical protein
MMLYASVTRGFSPAQADYLGTDGPILVTVPELASQPGRVRRAQPDRAAASVIHQIPPYDRSGPGFGGCYGPWLDSSAHQREDPGVAVDVAPDSGETHGRCGVVLGLSLEVAEVRA